ncbi:MAG: metallophosphoesterase [Bacteroidales bacterium]|nr:metallophosphoesterase [Bacteroidales bacterium]
MRIAFISDIHDDYESLLLAERRIEQNKCDTIVCLGDIVGYSVPYYDYFDTRNASACVKWVKKNCAYVVAGNHDLYAIRKLPQSNVRGFVFPENWYRLSFPIRKKMAHRKIWLYEDNELSALLDEEDMAYLDSLNEHLEVKFSNYPCLLSHFILPDLTGSSTTFINNNSCLKQHFEFLKSSGASLSFSGHMHAEASFCANRHDFDLIGYGKKISMENYKWVSVPCIANSFNRNGFLIWDTNTLTIETIPLKKKFNFL